MKVVAENAAAMVNKCRVTIYHMYSGTHLTASCYNNSKIRDYSMSMYNCVKL